jgi:Flp pilus assembly protein TadD
MQPKSGAAHPAASATAPAFAAPAAPQPSAAPVVAVKPTGSVAQTDEVDDEASSAPPGDRAVAQKMVAIARNKLKSRDAKGAADMMLRQVTTDPEDHHAMEVLVRAWIALGRGDDAVGYAELIVKKRPRRAGYRVLEGDARLSAGDAAGAQVAWRVALQLEPDNVEAKRRLGMP